MWILFALTSATILASRKIQEKKLVGNIGPALGWMLRLVSGICALIIWVIFSRDTVGMTDPVVISVILAVALLYPLQTHLYYRAMYAMPISVFGMMAGIVPLTSLILSHIFLGSPVSSFGLIAIGFTILAIAILSYKRDHGDVHISAILYAIGAYVLFGIGSVLDRTALYHIAPIPYTVLNQIVGAISIFVYTHSLLGNTQVQAARENIPVILMIGGTIAISWLLSSQALLLAPNPGYVGALQNVHMLITALYGVFILKEEITKRKIFVFICMLIALVSFAFA
ncbi:DMT family transporter [Candidatus Gracilibacteria bacterium]|nr:DMT family transporter [Candidatus Gracilibacteria bacterium]